VAARLGVCSRWRNAQQFVQPVFMTTATKMFNKLLFCFLRARGWVHLMGLVALCPLSVDTPRADTVTSRQACATLPPAPALGARRNAREFGAEPDDDDDDAEAIQHALDVLEPGEVLWFEPGRYLVGKSLHVRRAGLVLTGERAVLHATNPDDQALLIEADDTTVMALTFTAITSGRREAARHARIAVVNDTPSGYLTVRNTVIRDNRIVESDAPGTPGANSASAAGILLLRAQGFLVADNTVQRSLADGIHITGASSQGRVQGNRVRETGDDMIAVVSYAGSGPAVSANAQSLQQAWDSRLQQGLVSNVLIADNALSSPYWGRGISVVGGSTITIARNTLANLPMAAAILIAREATWQTFGVNDVLVEANRISDVQTLPPTYDARGASTPVQRTGHGAIEVHAALFDDEARQPALREKLAVRKVLLRGNDVERSSVSAVRVGVDMAQTMSGVDAQGRQASRHARTGAIEEIALEGGRFDEVRGEPVEVLSSAVRQSNAICQPGPQDEALAPACHASAPAAMGATLRCGHDGVVR
jgi:parallel beta-helix repeat protein